MLSIAIISNKFWDILEAKVTIWLILEAKVVINVVIKSLQKLE